MTRVAYCVACARNVYVADGDEEVCPVCSSPLVDGGAPEEEPESEEPESTGPVA